MKRIILCALFLFSYIIFSPLVAAVEFEAKNVSAADAGMDTLLAGEKLEQAIDLLARSRAKHKDSNKTGSAPGGVWLSFGYFMPVGSEFKNYYGSLMGGEAGYLMPIKRYLSLTGSARALTGKDESGNTRATSMSGAFGIRLSIPVMGFMYPYVGGAARAGWLHEKGENDSASFMTVGADALVGLLFMFDRSYGIYGEFSYGFSRAVDENNTDVSGMGLSGGAIVRF